MSDHEFVITIAATELQAIELIHDYLAAKKGEDWLDISLFGMYESIGKVNNRTRSIKITGAGNGGFNSELLNRILAVIPGISMTVKVKVPEEKRTYEVFAESGSELSDR